MVLLSKQISVFIATSFFLLANANSTPDCGLTLDQKTNSVCLNAHGDAVSTQYWVSMEQGVVDSDTAIGETNSQIQKDIRKQKDQSKKNRKKNYSKGVGLAAASKFGCGSTCGAMAVMAFANAIANKEYIADAKLTENSMENGCNAIDGATTCAGMGNFKNGNGLNVGVASIPELKTILADLKKDGISMDFKKKTITTPKGTFNMSDLNGASGFKKMGFDSGEVDNAFKELAKVQKNAQANVSKMALGDGGSGRSVSAKAGKDPFDDLLNNLLNKRRKKARKPASGKNKNRIVAGESIGVKGDDIFNMIHRRYKIKSRRDGFAK